MDRQFREAGITPTRLLRASFFCGAWMYEYELVGHGWVKRLRDRRSAPPINVDAVVSKLGKPWAPGGRAGLCKACRTAEAVPQEPQAMLDLLLEADPGAS